MRSCPGAARRRVGVAAAACVSMILLASGCFMGDAREPDRPVVFRVRVAVADPSHPGELDLHLDPGDAAVLGLGSPVVRGTGSIVDVPTPYVNTENSYPRNHCLTGPATIVERTTGATEAQIPAATCLEEYELVVPTAAVPDIVAEPEVHGGSTSATLPSAPLTGRLQVNIDGCTTIGGTRAIWPRGTTIDRTGSVVLPDRRSFANGAELTVAVRGPTERTGDAERCPAGPVVEVDGDA
jgi:hypothetical protein